MLPGPSPHCALPPPNPDAEVSLALTWNTTWTSLDKKRNGGMGGRLAVGPHPSTRLSCEAASWAAGMFCAVRLDEIWSPGCFFGKF